MSCSIMRWGNKSLHCQSAAKWNDSQRNSACVWRQYTPEQLLVEQLHSRTPPCSACSSLEAVDWSWRLVDFCSEPVGIFLCLYFIEGWRHFLKNHQKNKVVITQMKSPPKVLDQCFTCSLFLLQFQFDFYCRLLMSCLCNVKNKKPKIPPKFYF